MTRYNYRQAVLEDVQRALDLDYDLSEYTDAEEAFTALYDALWIDDSVTGNGSGSYTFSTWKAQENLSHNWDEIEETAEMFGCEPIISDSYLHGAEWWDVSIRCRYLDECLNQALEEHFNPIGIIG